MREGGVADSVESLSSATVVIAEFLENGQRPVCILEDALFGPEDGHKEGTRMVSLNEEVYYYLTKLELSLKTIKDTLIEAE